MAVIYYLNWDEEHEEHGPATELFHDLHVDDTPDKIGEQEFESLYREIREIPYDNVEPEHLWRQWNRGSGYESRDFLGTRYCDPCSTGFTSLDDSYHHFYHEHFGLDTGLDEFFDVIRGVRSMSVGDVVEIDDAYYQAQGIGWEEITVEGGN